MKTHKQITEENAKKHTEKLFPVKEVKEKVSKKEKTETIK